MDFAHGLNYSLSDYFLEASLAVAYLWPHQPSRFVTNPISSAFRSRLISAIVGHARAAAENHGPRNEIVQRSRPIDLFSDLRFLDPTTHVPTRDNTPFWRAEKCASKDLRFIGEHLLRKLLGLAFRGKCFGLSDMQPDSTSRLLWRFK